MSADSAVTATFRLVHQPDAQIKLAPDKSFLGAGIFNTTGAQQTRGTSVARGHSVKFNLKFVNVGLLADSIGVKGCPSSTSARVEYFQGTQNVTSEVIAGTYRTGTLAVGASKLLTLIVKVPSSATVGKLDACAVTASSVASPKYKDVVKADVKAAE